MGGVILHVSGFRLFSFFKIILFSQYREQAYYKY